MRAIRIAGQEHAIPSEREWYFRTQETINYPRQERVVTEYRFQAEPCNYVEVREMRQDIGARFPVDELMQPEEWVQLDCEPLDKYLVKTAPDPGQRYGGAGMDYDFAAHEKRFLEALAPKSAKLAEEMKNPCGDEYYYNPELNMKKTKKTRPKKNNTDPVKEAYEGYSTATGRWKTPQYPSFEEELLVAPERPATTAYYPKGYKGHRIKEEEDMPTGTKFTSGQRVVFNHPRTKDTEYGTVVGRPPEMRGAKKDQVLIATDRAGHYNDKCSKYTGDGYGIIVSPGGASMSLAMDEQWYNVPEHIGVYAATSFIHDDVKFKKGSTGRLLGPMHDNGTVDISWNFSNPNFHAEEDGAGNERHNQWSIPASKINMCIIDTYSKEVLTLWPASRLGAKNAWKKGDLCLVKGRSVTVLAHDDREVILPTDTIVELVEGGTRTWHCEIIGGCPDNILGQGVQIRSEYLREHPNPEKFYRPGQEVEIVAVIDFRKKPLQGMKGRVILSTDTEGDVGIEFKEDIGAGSLDGIGKEGHCIYIEASLVKSSE